MSKPKNRQDIFANEFSNPLVWALLAAAVISTLLPELWSNIVTTGFFFAFGSLCLFNFRRCKRYHCVITGLGFQVIGLLSLLNTLSVIDVSRLWFWGLFVGLLIVSYFLEFRYRDRSGSCYCE